ncbi:hypothetical protein CSZ94_06265 [Janthinobacterium sp. ROICE36]|uniref:hypothetical protein n=1 Tax=Janthinobacterium sp. ROICE36 TaxID=2048670 RepID=UPI000C7EC023|nr:hypothetical protein [Janthinobacterium sp. ROICE36]PLY44339.1 hypothetical protein CSZ94_06265 [Janthinobacterium sp. ROICE36]
MHAKKFIDAVVASNTSLLALYAQGRQGQTRLGTLLDALALAQAQREQILALIKLAIDDATYQLVCGIEGSASLGDSQQEYTLLDEEGHTLTGALDALLYDRLNT